MTTDIRISVTGGELLKAAQENQAANRSDQVQKEADRALVRQAEETLLLAEQAAPRFSEGGAPEYGFKEETSAKRGGKDMIAGINGYIESFGESTTNNIYFEAVEPQQGSKENISKTIVKPPDKQYNVPPPSGTYTTSKINDPGLYYANWYVYAKTGGWNEVQDSGTPGFSVSSEPLPWTETLTTTSFIEPGAIRPYFYQYYILPIKQDKAILVLQAKAYNFSEVFKKTRTETTSWSVAEASSTYKVFRKTVSIVQTVESYGHDEKAETHYLCFVYSQDKLRELTVPPALVEKLDMLMPDITFNSFRQELPGDQVDKFSDVTATLNESGNPYNGWDYLIIEDRYTETGYTSRTANLQNYSNRPYANASSNNKVLAKQFGLGRLKSNNHLGGPEVYFTPAVYTYLEGEMNLDTSEARNYQYMRQTYFGNAPSRYINLIVANESPIEKRFEVTKVPPVNITTPVSADFFTLKRIGFEGAYNAWDWGKPQYCQQKLIELGFTNADLTP